MDGKPEEASADLFFAEGAKFRLIEFKARAANINSEKRKFPELHDFRGTLREGLLNQSAVLTAHGGAAAHWPSLGQ
ncbi:hypothetical protein [Cupriavidus pauculus]|uniref:hypothetical protein n=1 Tax=Cupriavidus pauculus TaxID=82633 RepID=UPI001D0C7044|nr:hypothetical protein [Cupriavidus pauculus]